VAMAMEADAVAIAMTVAVAMVVVAVLVVVATMGRQSYVVHLSIINQLLTAKSGGQYVG